ncbi:hypothetical protein, partial [Acidianus sp. RZ1]|uniref:hypothetical protein n=1 Tax=Acidianus sp. RZ1 TaxID=1540082 RepID=UPI0014913128
MCDYKLIVTKRPIKKTSRNILVKREIFNAITEDKYLKVLVEESKDNMSRSYYYYILRRLKEIGAIEDNAISFRAIFPFIIRGEKVEIDRGIIFSSKDGIIVMDLNSEKYQCNTCPVVAECAYGLRKIASELAIKIKGKTLSELWNNMVSNII